MTLSDTVSERQQRDRTAETAAYAEKSARKKANRVQKASQRDQHTKATATARSQRKAEANIAMQEVRSFEQKQAAERKAEKAKLEAVPLSKNQNQNIPNQKSAEASDELIGINGMPLNQSAEEFLARACDLIRQTLGSEASSLALQDQRGLTEALSLVSTARVLVPLDAVAASESADRETGGFFGGESVAQDAWMEEEEL